MTKQVGVLIVLSGPSGVGKGVLRSRIAAEMPWLKESVSVTTRPRRPGETDGVDYRFVSRKQFEALIESDQLIEWAEYAGNFYGTPRDAVEMALEDGFCLLMEIDVQGALQIRRMFPEAKLIFVEPPSPEALKERLLKRNANHPEEIHRRLAIALDELKQKTHFDYVVMNDDLNRCQEELVALIQRIVDEARRKHSSCPS